jgi:photosystem II stability/assembly factor-like uncharacterized protein
MRRKVCLALGTLCLLLITAACSAPPATAPLSTAAPANSPAPTEAVAPTQALPTDTAAPTPLPPTADVPPTAVVPPTDTLPPATPAAQELPTAAVPAGKPIALLAAGQPVTVTALHMLDARTGWAVAQVSTDLDSRILQTADGAKTWRDVTPPEPASVPDPNQSVGKSAAAYFLNAQQAWVAFGYPPGAPLGNGAIVTWATQDGGKTWSPSAALKVDTMEQYWPSDMTFVDPQTGWLLVHAGAGMNHDYVAVYATQDGGATWTQVVDPMALPETGYLGMSCYKNGMTFVDAKNGWVAGDCHGVVPGSPYLYQTADGGRTWQAYTLLPPAEAPDLFTNENNACGAGAPVFVSPTEGKLPVSCQDLNNNQSQGWLYTTADAGKTWAPHALPAPYGDLQFINPNVGWWVGGSSPFDPTVVRQLYATQDGGLTWKAVKKLNWNGQVDFVDAKSGWAVAKSDQAIALVSTQDGGQKWSLLTPQVGR